MTHGGGTLKRVTLLPPGRPQARYPGLALDDEPDNPRTCVLCGLWIESDRVEGTCHGCAVKAAKVSGFWSPGSAPRRREVSPAVARPRNRSQVRSRKSPSPSRSAVAPASAAVIPSPTSEVNRKSRAGRPSQPGARRSSPGSQPRGNLGATAGPSDPGRKPPQALAPTQRATSSKPPLQPSPPQPPPGCLCSPHACPLPGHTVIPQPPPPLIPPLPSRFSHPRARPE